MHWRRLLFPFSRPAQATQIAREATPPFWTVDLEAIKQRLGVDG